MEIKKVLNSPKRTESGNSYTNTRVARFLCPTVGAAIAGVDAFIYRNKPSTENFLKKGLEELNLIKGISDEAPMALKKYQRKVTALAIGLYAIGGLVLGIITDAFINTERKEKADLDALKK